MKHSIIKAVCLVVLACVAVFSVYSDERTVDLTSIVLESFNGETAHEWNDGRHTRNYEFSWALAASRFATKISDEDGNEVQYPVLRYVERWPSALFRSNRDGRDIKSLGINGRFDRQGNNWIDIYPVQGEGDEAKAFEIPVPGRLRYLDLWVWGANLNYWMEAYFRDFQGAVHRIPLGSLAYQGWRNLRAHIPNHIHQSKRILPHLAQLKFLKFRIWTSPIENVSNFYIYLNQFKIVSDTFESYFDGDELADPDTVAEIWADDDN